MLLHLLLLDKCATTFAHSSDGAAKTAMSSTVTGRLWEWLQACSNVHHPKYVDFLALLKIPTLEIYSLVQTANYISCGTTTWRKDEWTLPFLRLMLIWRGASTPREEVHSQAPWAETEGGGGLQNPGCLQIFHGVSPGLTSFGGGGG